MTFSLDVQSIASLKDEAKALRTERAAAGQPISQGAALEEIAHRHGYRDWNTAHASLPERIAPPVQVGQRARGTYLGQPFEGVVLGVSALANMQHYELTVLFDKPVDVSRSQLFSAMRHRVRATVNVYGVSLSRTSDGEPHMRIKRI